MALYFDFKEKLALKFGRVIGQRVEPDQLVIGERTAPPVGSAYDSLIDLTVGGETRKVAYNRVNVAMLISSMTQTELIIDVPEGTSRLHDVLDKVNLRFGTHFTKDDVEDAELSPGTYPIWFTAKPTSKFYVGRTQLVFKQAGIPTVIRPATHVFDLDGNTADTGSEPVDMGVAFDYREIDGKKFAFLKQPSGHVAFDPKLRMRVCGEFTLDMEVYLDVVYGYLYMMTQNAQGNGGFNSYGQMAFYGNKFYQYGYTPATSATWQNRMPVIPAKSSVRLTLRSAFGMVTCYIDGEYIMQWPIPDASAGIELLGFRNVDTGASQWPVGCGLRAISYWDTGLSNNEIDLLFGREVPANRPLLHYPLAIDGRNIGESSVAWPDGYLTFTEVMKRKMARPASQGAPFGSSLNFNRQFTLQFDYYCPTPSGVYEGFFSDSTLGSINGALKAAYGLFFINGGPTAFTTTDLMQRGQIVTFTLMRGPDGLVHAWCDNKYLGYTTVPVNSPLLTHFGRAGEVANTTNNHFANIKYWERSFSALELKDIISPKAQVLAVCPGGTELSGATVIFDGNFGTFWNVTGDPTVIGKVPAEMVGKYIHNFRVHFATDSTNFKKKVRNINIDFKDASGNWVTYCSMSTQFCRNAAPDHETIIPVVPFVVPGRDIRIRCTGNWGDQFGYRWCTEIVLNYGDLKEAEQGGLRNPPVPLHHWPLNGDLSNKGSSGLPLAAAFDWVEHDEVLYASHATPKLQPLGVSLPNTGGYTMQFRIVNKTSTGVDQWQGIFNDASGGEAGPVVKVSCNDSPVKDWFAYMPGTWAFNRVVALAYKPGSENVVTIRGLNGTHFFWLNGILVLITVAPAGFAAWTHIGKAGQFMDKSLLLRDLKYWDTFLTDLELDYLFKQNADEPKPPLPPPPPPMVNPYPELTMPKVGWGFNEDNVFESVGRLTAMSDLSTGEFEVVAFGGEKYFSPKGNMGQLPTDIDPGVDFTLDFEIVATGYTTGDPYGVVLGNIRSSDPAAYNSIPGTLMTWRNITGVENAPVMISMGYGSPSESLFRPGFGEFKTRFTLRRQGNVFTWWRNGERVWTFSNTTKPAVWKFFGSAIKRALHLGRKFAYWDTAISDADMFKLFGKPAPEVPKPLHYWPLEVDGRNLGTDGRAIPGAWTTYAAANKTFMKPNAYVSLPAEFALNTAGEFTIDFEVSHAAPGGYSAFLYSTSWDALGAFTYYSGRLYHYLVTTGGLGGEWFTSQDAVTIDKPVRYTIVSKGGFEYWYTNGKFAFKNNAVASGSLLLRGIHAGVGLRQFSYWPKTLTDDELTALFARP